MGEGEETAAAAARGQVAGGYSRVRVGVLYAAWCAYRQKQLRFLDIRVFFAAIEMSSRRCTVKRGHRCSYSILELQSLVRIDSQMALRVSLRRLEGLGLLRFRAECLSLAEDLEKLHIDQWHFHEQFQRISNQKRRVPVPRRTLRMLAGSRSPVLAATVLGHLIRCVYAKGLRLTSEGSVSAGWVAETFGVDERNVKRTRAMLRKSGWLLDRDAEHWHRQRYGARLAINLQWRQESLGKPPPRQPAKSSKVPPPRQNRKLLNGMNNQKPERRPGDSKCSPGSMASVGQRELTDMERLLRLFAQAQKAGWVTASESDRLKFLAAASRARRCATRNPCGFFAAIVRRGLWHHIQGIDEDDARRRLARHLHPPGDGSPIHSKADNVAQREIRVVAGVTRLAKERGYRGDPFNLVQEIPGWNRSRWERAMRAWLSPTTSGGSAPRA